MQYNAKNTKHSLPRNAIGKSREDLKAMVEKGEITLDDAFDSLIDQHGALPKGENPKVDVTFPKKISKKENVSRYARTAPESDHHYVYQKGDIATSEEQNSVDNTAEAG